MEPQLVGRHSVTDPAPASLPRPTPALPRRRAFRARSCWTKRTTRRRSRGRPRAPPQAKEPIDAAAAPGADPPRTSATRDRWPAARPDSAPVPASRRRRSAPSRRRVQRRIAAASPSPAAARRRVRPGWLRPAAERQPVLPLVIAPRPPAACRTPCRTGFPAGSRCGSLGRSSSVSAPETGGDRPPAGYQSPSLC